MFASQQRSWSHTFVQDVSRQIERNVDGWSENWHDWQYRPTAGSGDWSSMQSANINQDVGLNLNIFQGDIEENVSGCFFEDTV